MTSVWDWILLSIQHRLQGLVVLGGDNPLLERREQISLQLLTPSSLAPTEQEGQVLRNIPSPTTPNIFAQQIQGPS